MANEFAASIDGIYHGFIRFRKHNYFTGDHLVSFGSLLRTTRRVVLRMASQGSDLVFGFQQVLFDLIILFFEGLGILDHFLGSNSCWGQPQSCSARRLLRQQI